jgi:hypothetical protein
LAVEVKINSTAVWYYPTILVASGLASILYDSHIPQNIIHLIREALARRKRPQPPEGAKVSEVVIEDPWFRRILKREPSFEVDASRDNTSETGQAHLEKSEPRAATHDSNPAEMDLELQKVEFAEDSDEFVEYSFRTGLIVIAVFLMTFITVQVVRVMLPVVPPMYEFFSNIFLAGTIICGGGFDFTFYLTLIVRPVVIPLLSDYVVAEGFVSSRNFLIGLAIIQSFPGPNFVLFTHGNN